MNPFNIGNRVRCLERGSRHGAIGTVTAYLHQPLAKTLLWRVLQEKSNVCMVRWDGDPIVTHYGYSTLELYRNGVEIMVDLLKDEAR